MNPAPKKIRKSLSLQTKIDILDCLAAGAKIAQIGRKFNISPSTIATIRHNATSIRQAVTRGADISASRSSYVRNPLTERMEKMLLAWMEDNQRENKSLDSETIRARALHIYGQLQAEQGTEVPQKRVFQASAGWFEKFTKRYSLPGAKGEISPLGASATFPSEESEMMEMLIDPEAASTCVEGTENHSLEFDQVKLGELLEISEVMANLVLSEDMNTGRAVKFQKDLNKLMERYKELHHQQSAIVSNYENSLVKEEKFTPY
ncbi:tigger transposable element-derived protein 1-like [Armigeres subalbatus]|uniref:tigger transposable element-derived protein 1-like n=1 Tax=Armigeres subalbatus TaxID=124917 RepID=UPI002ED264C6